MQGELDKIDRRMLKLLQADGRLSNAELAQKVSVSPATCHRRTQRLIDEGFIKGFRAVVDPQSVARGALVMVGVADFNRLHGEQLIAFPGVRQIRSFFVIKEVTDNAPLDF